MKKGFSIIEVLVVVALMAILTAIGATVFKKTSSTETLDKQAAQALSIVEEARNNALASLENTEYGIRFASSSVNMYEGKTYSSSVLLKSMNFTGGVYISAVSLNGGGNDVYFNRLTGEPSATGTVTFRIRNDAAATKTMTISGTGLSEVN
jgi:prepilin-type N-terminal cleavage/methylation domain-containing protein